MNKVTDINKLRNKKFKEQEIVIEQKRHWCMSLPGIGIIVFDPEADDNDIAAFLQGVDIQVYGAEARHPQEYIDMLYQETE